MAADPVLSRELQSLREELSACQRERVSLPKAQPTNSNDAGTPMTSSPSAAAVEASKDEQQLRDQLREFADEVSRFFDQTEKNISAHPIESVAGALLVGILIGRLLGRS